MRRKLIKLVLAGTLAFSFGFVFSTLMYSLLDSESGDLSTFVKEVDSTSDTPGLPPAKTKEKKKLIKTINPSEDQIVRLIGPVGSNSEFIADEIKRISKHKPVYLLINSPGGSVLDGALILSAIESAPHPVHTVCLQLCASMAAIIFEHGTTRLAVDRSFLMFHPASGGAQGEVDKMVSRLTSVQRYIGKMEAYIAKRAGVSLEKYKALSGVELWIDGEDAVNSGYADQLVSVNAKLFVPSVLLGGGENEKRNGLDTSKYNFTWGF